ncbi:hypothetical protein [Brevibacterium sp. HMSC063G07]|uniref:hypothetical protein n=1 Tax=Brevibacterium sp. HMSC063G07 TaxID=1739261 RepID=UPI0008A605A5|nr:hypothetical protein [Brevibacterium sp. HMSC063G07]OFL68519.1 hypothetical protein HMPREF2757_08585 [Brevibacterium sp. HMSC063G07]
MKTLPSLVLAPAVAAVTGFAAVPAFAAPGDQAPDTSTGQNSTPSSDSQTGQVSVSLAQSSIPAEQIADSKQGLKFTGTGFTPGDKATVTVIGTDGISYTPDTQLAVSKAGVVKGSYFFSTEKDSKVPEGSYRLFLTDVKTNEATELAAFTVGSKAADKADKPAESDQKPQPEGSAKPAGASKAPAGQGGEKTAEAAKASQAQPSESPSTPAGDKAETKSASPSSQPTPSETPSPTPSPTSKSAQPSETPSPTPSESTKSAQPTPSETPSASPSPKPSESPTSSESSKPAEKADDKKDDKAEADKSDDKKAEDSTPKVTQEQLPTSTVSFSSKRIKDSDFALTKEEIAQVKVPGSASKKQKDAAQKKSAEFAKAGKGAALTLKNGLPGATYTFKVQEPGASKPFELQAKTDAAGNASVWIYASEKAAAGTYKVTVEGKKAVVTEQAGDKADSKNADKASEASKTKPSEAPTVSATATPSSTPSSTAEAAKKDGVAKKSETSTAKPDTPEAAKPESGKQLNWAETTKLAKDKKSGVGIEDKAQVASDKFTVYATRSAPAPTKETPEQKNAPAQKEAQQQDKQAAAEKTTPSAAPTPATPSEAEGMNKTPAAPEAQKPAAEGDAEQKPAEDAQAEAKGDDQAEDTVPEAEQTDQADQSDQTAAVDWGQADTSGSQQGRELPNTTPGDDYAQSQEQSGSQMPRTGGDLTGLALGAGLVVVGAASIVVTRRKVSGV